MKPIPFAGHSAVNALMQFAGRHAGMPLGQPTTIYIIPTVRCQMRCRHCDVCRDTDHPKEELTLDEWREVIRGMAPWARAGLFTVTGGEPFLRTDLDGILGALFDLGAAYGIVTNGQLSDPAMLDTFREHSPSFVAVSLDGCEAPTVDDIRGRPGAFDRATETIRRLAELRRRYRLPYKLLVKTTVMATNLTQLPRMAPFVRALGADLLQLQPLEPNYDTMLRQNDDPQWYRRSDLWPRDAAAVRAVFGELRAQSREGHGGPLLNDAGSLSRFERYFLDPGALGGATRSCTLGHRSVFLAPWGGVSICPRFGFIGHVSDGPLPEIWRSASAARQRQQIAGCRHWCVSSCFEERGLIEKARLFSRLFGP